MIDDKYEFNLRELRYLVNALTLTNNLNLLPHINRMVVKIAMEEECFDLLTNYKIDD